MTPAIVFLKKKKVSFDIHQYQNEAGAASYGIEAAQKLDIEQHQVFKTIVLETDQKKLAKACKVKKVVMADKIKVQTSTGYILGGVSPLGQKKQLPTFINKSALDQQKIYVSAGRRGLEVSLTANDLSQLLQANFCDLV